MQLENSVAIVTGANRGMGRHYVSQLLERGASKVYAGVRSPEGVKIPGAEIVRIDITDTASVAAAAGAAADVNLLINNAGASTFVDLVSGDIDQIRLEMDTNFYGTLNMIRAFAPVLGANGGGAILNMLSALSWISAKNTNAYSAAKAAAWSLTNSVRLELASQKTLVVGLHVGAVDTDMMLAAAAATGYNGPKEDPAQIVHTALDAIAAGDIEVLADDTARAVKSTLANDPREFYTEVV